MPHSSAFRFGLTTLSVTALLGASALCSPANAGAFYIQEQSVSGLGTAFAGAVADTPDASTIYYNPAGMVDLKGAEVQFGANILIPDAEFKDTGSTTTTAGSGGAPVATSGRDADNPFDAEAVPNLYVAMPMKNRDDIWLGLGVSAPFGLKNKYNNDFVGRYDSIENKLMTINVAPSVAWRMNDQWSFGGGVDVQYADAMLANAIGSPATVGGPTPATDGYADLSGDDLSVGFNAGIIWKPMDGTRIGAHYRSGISHKLKGRLITTLPSDIGGTSTNVAGAANLDLPDMVTVGFSQKMGERFTLLGHVGWLQWSNFEDITVDLANGTSSRTDQNYRNTMSYAIGGRYQATDKLLLKLGFQYDETPTQDGFRTTRIPDGDRTWIAGGMTYEINPKWALDLSGAYVDVSKEKVNLAETTALGSYTVVGDTDGSVGIISAALRYKFDTGL